MIYNFDEIIERRKTNSVKYDLSKEIFGTDDVLPLWVADMDFKTPDFIFEALKKRLEHNILGYTFRSDAFYKAMKQWLLKRHNWDVDEKAISFSPGIVPALSLCILAFTQAGDEVMVQSPVYHPFFECVKNNGRQLLNNKLLYNEKYEIDFKDFKKKISSRTKLLLFSSPHNPVGRVWNYNELKQLGDICVENNIIIISDEIHSDIVFKPNKHIPLASISEQIAKQTVTCIAPSKTFNLAGLSTSALVIENKALKTEFDKTLDNIHVGQGNIFGNIALETAYNQGEEWLEQMLVYVKENIDFVCDYFAKKITSIKPVKTEGTYMIWLDCRELGMTYKKLNDFMIQRAKVGFSAGHIFGEGGEGFMRMNVACPRSILKQALKKIEKVVNKL